MQNLFFTVENLEKQSEPKEDLSLLCRRAQAGDSSARRQLLQSLLPLIIQQAKRYYRQGGFFDFADLVQMGSLGVIRAIEKFDPDRISNGRKVAFITYAFPWIAHFIRREYESRRLLVALPITQQRLARRRNATSDGQESTPTIGIDDFGARQCSLPSFVSIDHKNFVEGGERQLKDHGSIDDQIATTEVVRLLRQGIAELNTREQFILDRHFGLTDAPQNFRCIGREMGLSKERIRQLALGGIKKLRKRLSHLDGLPSELQRAQ